jgi:multidrug efflux pump subunit AcrA (membrane-fusion protein)
MRLMPGSVVRHLGELRRGTQIFYGVAVVVVAVVVVFALNAVYGFFNTSTASSAAQRTSTVALGTVQSSVSASGNVSAAESASLNFSTSGTVTSVKVATGDRVKAGQVIGTIDPSSASSALEAAQASLDQEESTLASAKSGGSASQKASNASSLLQAEQQVASAKQQLSTDKTTLATARKQLKTDQILSCPAPGTSNAGSSSSGSSTAGSSTSGSSTSATGSTTNATGATTSSSNSTTTGSSTGGSAGSAASTLSNAARLVAATVAPTAPTASTSPATSVTTSTATLNGSVNPGGDDTSYRFQYGLSASNLDLGTTSLDAGSGNSPVSVSIDVTGLQPGQTYYFRVVAESNSGTTDGTELTLATATAAAPTATTAAASGVGTTSATLSGTVNPNASDTSYHFEYGTTKAFGSQTPAVDAGSGTTATQVPALVTGLKLGTTYVYRLVATNASGTTTGLTQLFTTSTASAVVTGSASDITPTVATLSGTVSPQGANTSYYFEYGLTSSLGHRTATKSAGSSSSQVSVSTDVTGLEPGKTYHFRLVASNLNGTVIGTQETLDTPAALVPTVATSSASVTGISMTLSGTVDPNASDTTYYFEWGKTGSLEGRTAKVDAGSGTTDSQVSATVPGLKAGTTYGFRLVATNSYGTERGVTQVATTSTTSCATDATTISSDEQIVEQQEQSVKSAIASLNSTKASIAASNKPSTATLAQDDAAVKQAQATVTADENALDETTLHAPISGTVTAVGGSVGATVSGSGSSVSGGASSSSSSSSSSSAVGASSSSGSSSSSAFVTLDTLQKLEIVAGFAEADATKLAVGQPATITFPALTNVEVAGKVTAVSSTSTVVSNVVTYDVTIVLVNPPSTVKEGMTANVSVINQTRSNVLELPSSAITTTGTRSTVELLTNGTTTVTPVTTGLVGSSSTEIVSGLKKGDVVVVPTVAITAASSSSSTSTGGGAGGFGGSGGFGGGGFAGPGG